MPRINVRERQSIAWNTMMICVKPQIAYYLVCIYVVCSMYGSMLSMVKLIWQALPCKAAD